MVERTTSPAIPSDRNLTMANWCINVSLSSNKLHTQKLSTFGTISKRKQNVLKAFLKMLGLSKTEKLIQKMQQNIVNVKCKISVRTIQTSLNKKISKADAGLAQDLKTERQNTFVTNVINLYVRSSP